MIQNCRGGISVRKICIALDKYKKEHNFQCPKYLIMNDITLYELQLDSAIELDCYGTCNNERGYKTFRGIPVAICNKLKYGEIDFI